MPYLQHFALAQYPFRLTPDRALFFPDDHEKLLVAILYALRRGEGIMKVVGEVGTGKTMLCRMLIQILMDDAEIALINAPRSDPEAIALALCHELGLQPASGADLFLLLQQHLLTVYADGRPAVLLIDEAQALDRQGLETIRLLTNLETDDAKLLQIVLFGQPELDRLLRQYSMRQLSQRISYKFTTEPFDTDTAMRYIEYRIDRCSLEPVPRRLFYPRALKAIAKVSGGIPRVINQVADRALLAAYIDGAERVARVHVRAALADGVLADRAQAVASR